MQRHRDGVRVLVIDRARRAVGERAGERAAVQDRAVAVEPLGGASDVGERDAVLAVGVEARAVVDDQVLVRTDCAGRVEQRERELAGRCTRVAQRVVRALGEWRTSERDALHLGREIAHAARRPVRKPVADRHVPGVGQPGVLHVERELTPLAEVQRPAERRGTGLGHHELRRGDRERRRDTVLAGQRLVEHAVDQPPEVPLRGVHELRPDRVDRRVVEHDRQADHHLLERRHDQRRELERQHAAHIRELVRHREAGALPGDGVAHIGEVHARGVEVVGDGDAVQVVLGSREVDDRARERVEQDRDRQRVGEWHTDRRGRLSGRILLVDLLDRDEQVLAVLVDSARRAVHEPDVVAMRRVARHLAGVHDVVEDHEPAFVGVPGDVLEAEVGAHPAGVVADRAVARDLDLRGSRIAREAVVDALRGCGAAVFRMRRDGAEQEQRGGEQQPAEPARARPNTDRFAGEHAHPHPTAEKASACQWKEGRRNRPDSGGPAVIGRWARKTGDFASPPFGGFAFYGISLCQTEELTRFPPMTNDD
jgi:hypothetical protein